jgi:alcohol dehydrogenase class IV
MEALRDRAPEQIELLSASIGTEPKSIGRRIAELGRPEGLGAAGADRGRLEEALDAIEARPELRFTPEPPDREELRSIVESAW